LTRFLDTIAAGPLDWLALALFVLSVFAYGRFADRSGTGILNAHMRNVRRRWMLRYLQREDRVVDAIFTGHSMNSISLFSSATLLIVVALLGLLGNSDLAYRLASQSAFIAHTTGALFQVKLMGVACVFVYGFYRFTWALLQYNYLLALTASAPLTGDLTPETAQRMADKLSIVLNAAVTSFHSGFRTYYYALAWIGWFFHPVVFMAATLFVTFILVYRQLRSPAAGAIAAYATMLEPTDKGGGNLPRR
jgi:uncharacterized membrane protein